MGGWCERPYGPFSTTQKQHLPQNDSIYLLRIALLHPKENMHRISHERSFMAVNTGLTNFEKNMKRCFANWTKC